MSSEVSFGSTPVLFSVPWPPLSGLPMCRPAPRENVLHLHCGTTGVFQPSNRYLFPITNNSFAAKVPVEQPSFLTTQNITCFGSSRWTLQLFPCSGYWKQGCSEHWGTCVFLTLTFFLDTPWRSVLAEIRVAEREPLLGEEQQTCQVPGLPPGIQ